MEQLVAIVVGVLVAGAVYLMLDRSLMRFLFGLTLISNAVNLLLKLVILVILRMRTRP